MLNPIKLKPFVELGNAHAEAAFTHGLLSPQVFEELVA